MKNLQHVAFIMDGNRRWAKEHKLEMLFGHDKGAHQIEPLVDYAVHKGIGFVTFWAFSTENWQRSEHEVLILMEVFRRILRDPMIDRMKQNNVRFQTIGDISKFPEDIFASLQSLIDETKDNEKITVSIALNYGGRSELLRAMNAALSAGRRALSENEFARYLFTKGIPDPDLLIRTGGETRLSGFMPWQTVYAELYFTDVLWPDFDEKEFQKALDEYARRERRFGK